MRAVFLLGVIALFGFGCGGGTGGGGAGGGSGSNCDSSNCTGCCFNGSCQGGTTTAGCGKGGGACVQCINGAVCKADQKCGIDPASTWIVAPVSATLTTKNGTADWDVGGGAPDPFITLNCPAGSSTNIFTPVADDSFAPTWSSGTCTMTAAALMSTGFDMAMFDEDVTTDDVIFNRGTIKPTEAHLIDGVLTFNPFGSVQALRVNLIKQ